MNCRHLAAILSQQQKNLLSAQHSIQPLRLHLPLPLRQLPRRQFQRLPKSVDGLQGLSKSCLTVFPNNLRQSL
jgi:hypothetical protein